MDEPHEGRQSRVALAAGGVILALALLRAMAVQSPLPFWDADPLTVYTPIGGSGEGGLLNVLGASLTGLGPTLSILLDVLTLLAGGVAILFAHRADGRARTIASGLALVGSIGVAIHATRHGGLSLEHARIGIAWLGAIWGAIGLWCVAGDRRTRSLFAGILLAFVLVLAAKGLIQVLIEQPRTVASFDADKDAFFQSKGWAADSANAQAYERRLRQSEATGWFGLSNVLSSFAGASSVVLAMMLVTMPQSVRKSKAAAPVITLAIAALLALLLTKSKGGIGAAAMGGMIAFAVFRLIPARFPSIRLTTRLLGTIACAAVLVTVLGIVLRGLVGETIPEPSTLFRWFYMQGAGNIIADKPLTGVGPSGFQSAYSQHKPPLSPEDVTSPHSILFDLIATLGVFGVAFALLAMFAVWRIGSGMQALPTDQAQDRSPITRQRVYLVSSIAATAFFAGLWLERGGSMPLIFASVFSEADPVSMAALVFGLLLTLALVVGWVLLAERLWSLFESQPQAMCALAGGGLVIAIHAQLEMTPIQPSSAALFWAWLALAAASMYQGASIAEATRNVGTGHTPSMTRMGWSGLMPIALGVLILTSISPSMLAWESRLVQAAHLAAPVGNARTDLRILRRVNPALRGPAMADLAKRVAAELGQPVGPTPSAIGGALDSLALIRGEQAELILDEAHDAAGGIHPPTLRAQTKLLRRLASDSADPSARNALMARAIERAERLTTDQPELAGGWSLLGLVHSESAAFSDQAANLIRARAAWEREIALDPHSLGTAIRLMDTCEQLGDRPAAAAWASRALEINEHMRLDTLKQLDGRVKARAKRIAANP